MKVYKSWIVFKLNPKIISNQKCGAHFAPEMRCLWIKAIELVIQILVQMWHGKVANSRQSLEWPLSSCDDWSLPCNFTFLSVAFKLEHKGAAVIQELQSSPQVPQVAEELPKEIYKEVTLIDLKQMVVMSSVHLNSGQPPHSPHKQPRAHYIAT